MAKTYEVRVYKDEATYLNSSAGEIPLIDGITNKRDALKEGKLWLEEFPIVKVQSSNREFIEVLTRDGVMA